MVKRKQKPSLISIDVARWGIIVVLLLLALVISGLALSSFVRHSRLFVVRDVVVSENLGGILLAELSTLKGVNIFQVDLGRIEQKIIARYPGIAGLEVLRRFPDEILVVGSRRTPLAAALMDGKSAALSSDGCFLGLPSSSDGNLPVIKGLRRQKSAPGTNLTDPMGLEALKIVELIGKDPVLTARHLRSLDISDPEKMVASFGRGEDPARFEVIVDKDNDVSKLRILSQMIARTEFAINEVKYIDLRFDSPVIGKRKTQK